MVFTSRWAVFEAEGLEDNAEQPPAAAPGAAHPARAHPRQRRPHGARAQRRRAAAARTAVYTRVYPERGLFAHPVGYSFLLNGRRGLERSRNDELAGEEDEFESILSGLEDRTREGFDVVTNLDVDGQRTATRRPPGPQGRGGGDRAAHRQGPGDGLRAGVRPEPIPEQASELEPDPNKPVLNRTTQEAYPPGSTFKVVTATAALDTGKVTPDTIIDGSSPRTVSGAPLDELRGHRLRSHHAHRRAHQLGEHRVRPDRRGGGPLDARRVHGALRLLRGPASSTIPTTR